MESMLRSAALAAALLCAVSCQAFAQDTPAASTPPAAAGPTCCVAAADTLVEIETTEAISSQDRKPGDSFGLRLRAPLVIDGAIAIPAGTTGVGQIVHADRARGGGKPGELILAARYLQLDGRQVRLHGMKLSAVGGDHSRVALATAMAVGVFAQFVHGGEVQIPAGTPAQAKLVAAFSTAAAAAEPVSALDPPAVAIPAQAAVAPLPPQPAVPIQE